MIKIMGWAHNHEGQAIQQTQVQHTKPGELGVLQNEYTLSR